MARTPRLISLDHFRSRVYRPRLALLILLVLLSGCVTPPSGSGHGPSGDVARQSVTTSKVAPTGRSAFVGNEGVWRGGNVDGDATTTRERTTTKPATETETTATSQPSLTWSPRSMTKWFKSTSESTSSQTQSHRLAISLFLSPSIFPTLIQLHVLWLVRFVAGEIEGRLSSTGGGSTRPVAKHTSRSVLAALGILLVTTLATLHPRTTSSLHGLATKAVSGSTTFSDPSTLFPSTWILCIEAVPTLLSLLPLLVIGAQSTAIPSHFSVPSPSHLPSLLELLPFWIRAPLTPSEQDRARRSAVLSARTRRHGAFGRGALPLHLNLPPTPTPMLRPEEDLSSGNNSEAGEGHSRSVTDATRSTPPHSQPSTATHSRSQSHSDDSHTAQEGTRESTRILRLQQAMVSELTQAGRLPSRPTLDGKTSLHQRNQRVSLPTSYFLSLLLSLCSYTSLIISYSLITLRLPNLAPTSVPAIVSLLAIRAQIGGLVKYWNEERRRVEGLEFVRRRWGVGSAPPTSTATPHPCSICFEPIDSDGIKLDCSHELHAPCLVPWLMSQSFCPVCHRPLRPGGLGTGTPGHSRSGSASVSLRRRRHRRSRSGARADEVPGEASAQ